MEIQVNGKAVAKVNGFTRSVSIRTENGEVTNFPTAPGIKKLNIITEQKLPANAPRLDEVEFLQYLDAKEKGLLEGDPDRDGPSQADTDTERISESELTSDEEETEEDGEEETEENNDEDKAPQLNLGS